MVCLNISLIAGLLSSVALAASEAPFGSRENSALTLDNGVVERPIACNPQSGAFLTTGLKIKGPESENYLPEGGREFQFTLNGKPVTRDSHWDMIEVAAARDSHEGEGMAVTLAGDAPENQGLEITITYLLYPELPVIRKRIAFRNRGAEALDLESLEVEHQKLAWGNTHIWIMKDCGHHKHLGPFVGGQHDSAVPLHHITLERGLILGNEAPGATKRTSAFVGERDRPVTIGLTRADEDFPFRKWLHPDEAWESPNAFIALDEGTRDPLHALNSPVADDVRQHFGIRLAELERLPVKRGPAGEVIERLTGAQLHSSGLTVAFDGAVFEIVNE